MKAKTEAKPKPEKVQFVVRLDEDLHAALVKEAAAAERSLNSHVIFLLKNRPGAKSKTGA